MSARPTIWDDEMPAELARDLVGEPRPAPVGVCCMCGTPAPGRSFCPAHEDLEEIDDGTSPVVTTPTTNGGARTTLDGKSASTPQGG